eukprot:scaffold53_cov381-Pavlova_lutheri.AAC.24
MEGDSLLTSHSMARITPRLLTVMLVRGYPKCEAAWSCPLVVTLSCIFHERGAFSTAVPGEHRSGFPLTISSKFKG